jgi:chromosome segregation ATPase
LKVIIDCIKAHEAIPYQEALKNKETLAEHVILFKKLENDLAELQRQIEQLKQEKANLQGDLATSRDNVAAKQGQLTTLLEELATTRTQLENMVSIYIARTNLVDGILSTATGACIPTP